jgi:hypothetical protein
VAALWIVVGVTVVSGIDYFRRFFGEATRETPRPAKTAPESRAQEA